MTEAYIKLLEKVTLTTDHFNGAMLNAITAIEKQTLIGQNIDKEIKGKKELKKVDDQLIRLRHKLNRDLEDHHHRQVRRNMQIRDQNKGLDSSFAFMTKTMTGGFGFQAAFEHVTKTIVKSTSTFNALGESTARLEKAQSGLDQAKDNLKQATTPTDKKMLEGELEMAQKEFNASQEEHEGNQQKTGGGIVEKKGFKQMFSGLNKLGGLAKKGALPIGIGMGVAGILMSVIVKALSASPLFQQIMKMIKFSVNLILMPIGTFFGAILRPILITLLRKFIIPYYSTWMPKMMTLGTSIGEGIIEFFEVLEKEGLGAAMGVLFKDVDVGALIWDALAKTIPAFAAADFIGGLFKIGDGTDANGMGVAVNDWFTKGLAEATTDWDNFWTKTSAWFSGGIDGISDKFSQIWTNYKNWVTGGINGLSNKFGEIWTNYKSWVTTGLASATTKFSEIWDSIVTWFVGTLSEVSYGATVIFSVISGWFAIGLNKAETTFTGIWDAIISWFQKGINGVSVGFGDIIDTITNAITGGGSDYDDKGFHKADWNKDLNFDWLEKSAWNATQKNKIGQGGYKKKYADGGIINEPVSGIGMNSGQSYLLGESGAEMVTPLGKSGGGGSNITINIQNMNGSDDDMRKLKKTILDVLQESSASRGRI